MVVGAAGRGSRAEYARRMHRVVAHIDRHLEEELSVASLAEVAHFSPFHFHRLFAAWMGEPVGEYLRRRRLEVAATRLAAQPRTPVLEIALTVGFGSAEAFAHAFKGRFGMSASAWRRLQHSKRDQTNRNDDQADLRPDDDDGGSFPSDRNSMDVRLVERQATRIVYLRYVGPYGRPLAKFWRARVMPWIASRALGGRAMIAISHDNPRVTAPEKCRCDIGVEVDGAFVPVGDEQVTVVPGGRYATTRFFGTPDGIADAWTALFRDWLPDSGLQLDARPTFEYYPADMKVDHETGAFECVITIPVMPL